MQLSRRKFVWSLGSLFVPSAGIAQIVGCQEPPFISSAHTSLVNGLVSYWKMYEAANTTRVDSQAISNLADVNSNVPQVSTSILGGFRADFGPTQDTTRFLQASDVPYRLGSGKSFTMSGWM